MTFTTAARGHRPPVASRQGGRRSRHLGRPLHKLNQTKLDARRAERHVCRNSLSGQVLQALYLLSQTEGVS